MWLWSPVDEEACHKRRYVAGELERKSAAAGFRVLHSTSFVALLLPLLALTRLLDRRRGRSGGPRSLHVHPVVNSALETVLGLERAGIRSGLSIPVGGSRLVVLQKA
jgi:hypothetical protein